ncbi:MAG: hypothetical protein GWN84_13215 [Gammaproteobacteria bacterium]|nr:hypothetical protein [Gammaproteobacteria bacterium]NIR83789.1 hypothetical protein [Gammaproteobacteria bacterium]NIU05115.1 hypothetical protein [Gammaproteobacteria bacterium]NIV51952.1 hypothetical protein [Gammaproteobacteria bacterium]NIX86388.1 hypothetical protein [Gammaproteobacteria bacterium]
MKQQKQHWAVGNPGLADHYRALARAACEALGLDVEADDLAPIDVKERVSAVEKAAVTRGVCIAATTAHTGGYSNGADILKEANVTRQEAIDAGAMQFDLDVLEGAFADDEKGGKS